MTEKHGKKTGNTSKDKNDLDIVMLIQNLFFCEVGVCVYVGGCLCVCGYVSVYRGACFCVGDVCVCGIVRVCVWVFCVFMYACLRGLVWGVRVCEWVWLWGYVCVVCVVGLGYLSVCVCVCVCADTEEGLKIRLKAGVSDR